MYRSFSLLWLILAMLAITFSMGCQRTHKTQNDNSQIPAAVDDNSVSNNDTLLNEGFEKANKTSYQKASIAFESGSWILDDAIVAAGNPYMQPDDHAIRIRNHGKLSMDFDVEVRWKTFIELTKSVNGRDKPSNWGIFVSLDKGKTYSPIFLQTDTNTFARKIFLLDPKLRGSARFQIRKLSGGKNQLNIDDFVIFHLKDTVSAISH
jgi:endonuclease G